MSLHKSEKHPDRALVAYVAKNLEKIKGWKNGTIAIPKLEIVCEKRVFPCEKDAKEELARILPLDQSRKKPIRSYECDKCSGWHLTSIPLDDWKKRVAEYKITDPKP